MFSFNFPLNMQLEWLQVVSRGHLMQDSCFSLGLVSPPQLFHLGQAALTNLLARHLGGCVDATQLRLLVEPTFSTIQGCMIPTSSTNLTNTTWSWWEHHVTWHVCRIYSILASTGEAFGNLTITIRHYPPHLRGFLSTINGTVYPSRHTHPGASKSPMTTDSGIESKTCPMGNWCATCKSLTMCLTVVQENIEPPKSSS